MNLINQQTREPHQEPHVRLLTVADLAALPSELPSGTVRYELDYGRLVIMAPPGDVHGVSEFRIAAHLFMQGDCRGLGTGRSGEVGIILHRNPDRVVGADAAFITSSRPVRLSPEGYLETIPDLVVEVRSKNDSGPEVERKVGEYQAAGVRVVWVADPEARTVTAHRAGQPPQVFRDKDEVTVEDVIPGFRMAVATIFP